MTETQIWFCDECSTRGEVTYGPDEAGVMSVAYKLRDGHSANSPECTATDIRVLIEANATAEEVAKVMALKEVG